MDIYIDETRALYPYPLHMPEIKEGESKLPETFPSGV
jgi:hypothetical protein